MARWGDRSGQATGEYVALVALVATTLALAAGLTSGGVGARVLAGLQRGLCAVAKRDCPPPTPLQADLRPCPLERSERTELLSATLGIVRLGGGGTLGAVRGSDGRVTVTLADDSTAGGEAGAGLRLRAGGRSLSGEARARLAASWTSGRSWTFSDAASARAFVARYGSKATVGGRVVDGLRSRCSLLCDAIGWRPHPQLPPPDATYEEGGTLATLTGRLGLGGPVPASAEAHASKVLGRRIDRAGATTWYVEVEREALLALDLEPAELGIDGSATSVASYTLDPAGRPISFTIHIAGATSAGASLSASGRVRAGGGTAAGGTLRAGASAGPAQVVERDATLDLHDPANRDAAAGAFPGLAGRGRFLDLPARLVALRRRIGSDAEVDRRIYALRRSATGLDVAIGLGAEFAAGLDRTREGVRLLAAETRLPGLPFLPRDDCRRG
jgi:hypothetical protein